MQFEGEGISNDLSLRRLEASAAGGIEVERVGRSIWCWHRKWDGTWKVLEEVRGSVESFLGRAAADEKLRMNERGVQERWGYSEAVADAAG